MGNDERLIAHYDIDRCERVLISKNIKQKDLAEPGLSESVISKFFRRQKVEVDTAKKIIRKLGLKWDDIVIWVRRRDARGLEAVGARRRA